MSLINNDYINARYAPVGSQKVGDPFPAYKEYAGRLTQWQPSANTTSGIRQQMNLGNNNTYFRKGITQNAIGIQNRALNQWVSGTQTLQNISADTLFCTDNSDCIKFGPNYKCNANYQTWADTNLGNQTGSYCSKVLFPEIDSGSYKRVIYNGGIGTKCVTDGDCAKDGNGNQIYYCNNSTDFVGHNIQQTGYCSMKYSCGPGDERFLGTPYNSAVPIVPDPSQNNYGSGYNTIQECKTNANASQDCRQLGSKYYAVYPGYCPMNSTSLRASGNPEGALQISSENQVARGFAIPAYATNQGSNMGGLLTSNKQAALALAGSLSGNQSTLSEPLRYEMSLNPRPPNF